MKGLFITFEGIEGSGKTTQIKMVSDLLKEKNQAHILTREPGGTVIGDQIREILLHPANTAMKPRAELLLYAAARAQHVEEVVLPATESGKTVLCDRYADASTAYQGAARALPTELLKDLHEIATGSLVPDLTFLLDLPADVGLERARSRNLEAGKEDRFENEKLDFHNRVREGYLQIAKNEPERMIVINANQEINEIYNDIVNGLKKHAPTLL